MRPEMGGSDAFQTIIRRKTYEFYSHRVKVQGIYLAQGILISAQVSE